TPPYTYTLSLHDALPILKFTFGRPATMHGVKIDNTMGVNTWAAFAGADDNAVVDGDFAVTEDELQAVLKSLVKQKIYIVAIHQRSEEHTSELQSRGHLVC